MNGVCNIPHLLFIFNLWKLTWRKKYLVASALNYEKNLNKNPTLRHFLTITGTDSNANNR